jgi:hypothetical protein
MNEAPVVAFGFIFETVQTTLHSSLVIDKKPRWYNSRKEKLFFFRKSEDYTETETKVNRLVWVVEQSRYRIYKNSWSLSEENYQHIDILGDCWVVSVRIKR